MKRKDGAFSKYIAISIAFHIAVLIVLTVKVFFFPDEIKNSQQTVRVDVVALPEKNVQPPKPIVEEKKPEPIVEKKPEPVVEKKPEPVEPKPVVIKKKPKKDKPKKISEKKNRDKKIKQAKKEQNAAMERIKALKKIRDRKKKEQSAINKIKGNVVSKGNGPTGMDKLNADAYKSDLEAHIKSHWTLPEWLKEGNYKAIVLVFVSRAGDITSKAFVTKSGNKLFDEQVLATLEKANPLPKPPSSLIDLYSKKGVKVSFP